MSTTDPAALQGTDGAERRLHPMSWLFVLLQQLKQFVLPLIALVFFGHGDRNELWPLVGVGVLVVTSVWRYFTYRYAVQDDRIVVRSGLLERSARIIPFARIHNVALQQSLLHRVFRVAEVKLESAGGKRPEAEMRVLALDDALALEALVRRRGQPAPGAAGMEAVDAVPEPQRLLHLPPGEVVRLGLISNRGLVVVAAGFAGLMQIGPQDMGPRFMQSMMSAAGERLVGYGGAHGFDRTDYLLAALALLGLAAVALRLLSVVLALLQYWNFTLTEQGRRLTVERGLAARWRTSVPRRRIQAWTLREGVLHRLFRRRTLQVDIATGADPSSGQRPVHELAPVAPPAACDALVEHLLPRAGWSTLQWTPFARSAWWRLMLSDVAFATIATLVLVARFGAPGLLALLWLPWAAWLARRRIAAAAHARNDVLVAVRDGWWSRRWRFAEIAKVHVLALQRSPLDRRCGTASLLLDTSGGGMGSPPLRIPFLPLAQAQALHALLAAEIARRPLRG
ncbi:MAG: PH domain-containing protein [Pseudomonadota bacterium]